MPIDTQFIASVFEPDDLVEVRLIPRKSCLFRMASEVTALDPQLDQASSEGQHVYIGANPREREGGTAQDVALARCLFVDLDKIETDEAAQRITDAGLPVPTLTVASGHGVHAWWRLTEPMTDLEAWSGAQRELIRMLNSDPVIHDPPRIMRLPRFRNHKPPLAECYVVGADPQRRHALTELVEISTCADVSRDEAMRTPSVALPCKIGDPSTDTPQPAPDICLSNGSNSSDSSAGSAISATGCSSCVVSATPEQVIQDSQPTDVRQRNACVLTLARGLKFNCGLTLAEAKPFVRIWHKEALPVIGTKSFDVTWGDFVRAWTRAVVPLYGDPVKEAFQQALDGRLPSVVEEYDSQPVKLLLGVCANLAALRPDGHFFLSSHDVAGLLGVEPAQAWKWLHMFCAEDVIELVFV